jgi:O-acetyl-ADP-ribose deacetylase (regulator of RNase III)
MIRYVTGDATNPLGPGQKIIAHVCNDIGRMGAGFALALSKKWPFARSSYLDWYSGKLGRENKEFISFGLGKVLYVRVASHITIANMVAQAGTKTGSKGPPIRYGALKQCLAHVAGIARGWAYHSTMPAATLHLPRIGCGLAGGKWSFVEPILLETCGDLDVTVYDKKNS